MFRNAALAFAAVSAIAATGLTVSADPAGATVVRPPVIRVPGPGPIIKPGGGVIVIIIKRPDVKRPPIVRGPGPICFRAPCGPFTPRPLPPRPRY